jgi:hypothetical protein
VVISVGIFSLTLKSDTIPARINPKKKTMHAKILVIKDIDDLGRYSHPK